MRQVQATEVDYQLHTLGWKSFESLARTVAREFLQKNIDCFAPIKDGGRDGAFLGEWIDKGNKDGSCGVIQCKYTSKAGHYLKGGMLREETEKVTALAKKGIVDTYVLLTNHNVLADDHRQITEAFKKAGAKNVYIHCAEWLTEQIRQSPRLRMLVPKIYGLGDLSEILDDRRYEQARALLTSIGDDLKSYVVTQAYRDSEKAIGEHGAVVLLGDAASGKSTIAACLALGMLDQYKMPTIRINEASEFSDHWNPKENGQFFWIDDAFGATQYQQFKTDEWNKCLPMVKLAMKQGSKFLITSRTYIWNEAKADLKIPALPVLGTSQIVINVQALSDEEKAQILYNHIKHGDQSQEFKRSLKPFLANAALDKAFLPVIAYRLGQKMYTRKLSVTAEGMTSFVRSPMEYLIDVLQNLGEQSLAALGLVFMFEGKLPSPIPNTPEVQSSLASLGTTLFGVKKSLEHLSKTVVSLVQSPDETYWTFKHPTLRDAYASILAKSPERIEIYLRGAPKEMLLREITCGGMNIKGAAIRVPESLYEIVFNRISEVIDKDAGLYFLRTRCGKSFLSFVLNKRPDLADQMLNLSIFLYYNSGVLFMSRLHRFGLLPESVRSALANAIKESTLENQDPSMFSHAEIGAILTPDELAEFLPKLKKETFDSIDSILEIWNDNYQSDFDPDDYFDDLMSYFDGLEKYCIDGEKPKIQSAKSGLREIHRPRREEYNEQSYGGDWKPTKYAPEGIAAIFSDVDL